MHCLAADDLPCKMQRVQHLETAERGISVHVKPASEANSSQHSGEGRVF